MLRKRRPRAPLPLEQADSAPAALAAAVAHLSRRDFCSAELAVRLASEGFSTQAVQAALAQACERRYVDDERYAQQFVASRAQRGQGPLRIRRELTGLGLSEALAEGALQTHGEAQGGWVSLARAVRIRRFGAASPRGAREAARQARFLQYRGFSNDDIRSAAGHDID